MKQKKIKQERKELVKKIEHKKRLIKDGIIRDIRTLFKQAEDYFDPERISNFCNNNYIEYESNCDKGRNLSLNEYLSQIETYLRNNNYSSKF